MTLREQRLTAGIGRITWARHLGVARPTITRWEAIPDPPVWLQLIYRGLADVKPRRLPAAQRADSAGTQNPVPQLPVDR